MWRPNAKTMGTPQHNSAMVSRKGGEFLVGKSFPEDIFISEELTEEQRMIAEMVTEFCEEHIQKRFFERGKEFDVTQEEDKAEILALLKMAGEMGLCGIAVPEEYGGTDLDFRTNTVFTGATANGFSFGTTLGVQTSIGSLPIVYYGNKAQKEKYLPGIATAELVAAYALTEPNAGSDANSGRTSARLSEDGKHYLVNGQKIWISNGGFADVFVVFAKIEDDENLSALIIEGKLEGFSIGNEERKMGIKGSSTVQIFFDDVKVPVENLLGNRNEGFKIALNILNGGRLKLGAGGIRASQILLSRSVKFAKERKQFGVPISDFGAIQYKVGQIATDSFACDAALFRIAGLLDEKVVELRTNGMEPGKAKVEALREYAIEAAIIKVKGTDLGVHATDEGIQIHGGMGYAVETGMEMAYRDARITRIYEGTNEINRLLSVAELSKRGIVTKEIDLMGAGKKVPGFILRQLLPFKSKAGYAQEIRLVRGLKSLFLLVSGSAGKKLGKKLVDEQEMVLNFADILAEAFVSDSVLLKMQKLETMEGQEASKLDIQRAMTRLYLYEAREKALKAAREAIASFAVGSQRRMLLRMTRILLPNYPVNPKELRRQVARFVVEQDGYCF